MSPIDMETQERIKAERKKLRNRVAASKCRKRKLERIARLEDKVKDLKTQNSDFTEHCYKIERTSVCVKTGCYGTCQKWLSSNVSTTTSVLKTEHEPKHF